MEARGRIPEQFGVILLFDEAGGLGPRAQGGRRRATPDRRAGLAVPVPGCAGGYRWYMNHQRRFHTLVSHVRGLAEPVTFAGAEVTSAIPAGVAEGGNITVYFEALSYAGTLTAITDPRPLPRPRHPDRRPELDKIIHYRAIPR